MNGHITVGTSKDTLGLEDMRQDVHEHHDGLTNGVNTYAQ